MLDVDSQVQFTSSYGGRNVVGKLGSSLNFTWTFNGSLKLSDWGTKRRLNSEIDDLLVSLSINGLEPVNPPALYDGRVNGSWDGNTDPGRVVYTLTSIKKEDSKFYTCRITPVEFGANPAYDTFQLVVIDSPNSTIIPPKVVLAKEGSSASFTCNASGIPSPDIIWTSPNGKSGNEIAADSVKYQVMSTSGSSQLTIKDVSVEDQGYYLCNASNFDFDLDRAFLGVTSLYKSNVSCPSTNQSASPGIKTTICCPIRGFPPPEVTWRLPNGTVRKTANTILSIAPKTEGDFGKYTCSAAGLKETVPDPIVVSINLEEKGKKTSIGAEDITQLKTGEKFQWDKVEGAKNYICRICGPDINCSSLLGYEPSLEIPYSALNFKSEKNKPDPVEVAIVVLAVSENDVIKKGGPFNISITSVAATPRLSFVVVFVLFISVFSLLQ